MAEHDQVVHFAAESHVDRSLHSATEFVRTNVLGTQVLLDSALRHGIDRFVHISTDEVYGSVPEGSTSEEHPLHPNSPYAASKAASDLVALSYHRSHGLDVRVTRCSNNYGHHQFPEKIIPLFVTRLLTGAKVPLYGDGMNVRDWLHIDDHVRAVELVRTRGRAKRSTTSAAAPSSTTAGSPNCSSRRAAPAGTASSTSPTARATTAATPWTGPRRTSNSATSRRRTSPRASPRPSPGTATTPRCGRRPPAAPSCPERASEPRRAEVACPRPAAGRP